MPIAQYVVRDAADGEWLFTAPPLQTAYILNLHRDAMRRIEREAARGEECTLHGNGKPFLNRYPSVRVAAIWNVDDLLSE